MSENSINVGLNVTSNGTTEKETKLAKNLNQELEKAAKATTRVPRATAAARQGVDNTRESGTARGIGGQTGAEGRDFAKQASGLGGLVHVYATFAANLFAISAGFQALSKAANISNMVKGLDQLGAASGRGLGSLAKQLSQVTDGAVSLQEAMTATAQASSAGITSSNILRMGEVAKRASQALGRDMTDSLSRLSRGITKIEPELLDELGIMVKVDQASQNYARTLGKSASALTDFEKRQAFANEVLTQAEQKFGNINLDANPYQKISASISNLTQNGLELVNKVLTPLLDVLSKSPVALAGVLGGIATLLLKQALPAITQWKEGLRSAAEAANIAAIETAKLRKVRAESFTDKEVDTINTTHLAAVAKQKKAIEDLKLAVGAGAASGGTKAYKSAINDTIDNETKLTEARSRASNLTKSLDKLGDTAATSKVNKLKTELELQQKLILTTEQAIAAEARLNAVINEKAKTGLAKFLDVQNLNNRIADKAESKARSSTIVNNAVANTGAVGPKDAILKLFSDVNNAKKGLYELNGELVNGKPMSTFAANITKLKAVVGIATSYITTLASAISNVFAIVGIAVVAFQLLDTWFSKSAKQAEDFSNSTDFVNASVDTLKRTLDNLSTKSLDAVLSTDSLQAKATALQELSDALIKQSKDFDSLTSSMNTWEKGWDAVKDLFGFGIVDKVSGSTKASIDQITRSFSNTQQLTKFKSILESIYGTGVDSGTAVEKIIDKLSKPEAANLAAKLASEYAKFSREISNAIAPATELEKIIIETGKTAGDLVTSLKLTDPFTKMGVGLLTLGKALDSALEHPLESISAVVKLLDNPQLVGIFPPSQLKDITKAKQELISLNKEQKQYSDAALAAEKLKQDLVAKEDSAKTQVGGFKVSNYKSLEINTQIVATSKTVEELKTAADSVSVKAASAVKRITEELVKPALFAAAVTNLNVGLKNAFAQAGVAGAKAFNSVIGSLGVDTSVSDAELRLKEINLRVAEVNARGSFLKAQIENTLAIKEQTLATERSTIEVAFAAKMGKVTIEDISKYSNDKKLNEVAQGKLKAGRELISSNAKLPNANNKEAINAIGIDNYAALLGLEGQKAQAGAEAPAAALDIIIKKAKEEYTLKGKKLENDIQSNKILLDSLSTLNSISSVQSEDFIKLVASAEQKKLNLAFDKESLSVTSTLAAMDAALASGKLNAKTKAATLEQRSIASEAQRLMIQQKAVNQTQLEYDTYLKLYTLSALLKQNEIESNRRVYDARVVLIQETLNLEEKRLSLLESQGLYSNEEIARKKNSLADTKQNLDNETALLSVLRSQADARTAMSDKLVPLANAAFTSDGQVKDDAAKAKYDAQATELDKLKNEQSQILSFTERTNKAKLDGLEITKQQAIEQAKHNDLVESLTKLTEDLSNVFGKVGSALGEVTSSMVLFAEQTAKYNKERIAAEERLKNSDSFDREANLKSLQKLNDRQAKKEQDNQLAIISGTKKIFSEKTVAYKTLDTIEKVMHLRRLWMNNQELISTITTNAKALVSSIATSEASVAASIPGIFAKFSEMMGPWGWAAAAAVVAKLGFSSNSSPPKGFTAEEAQKTNGTGAQRYDSRNNLVNTGGGVKGDMFAKSEDISKSIDLVSANTNSQLQFSNKQLDALLAIKKNTEGLAGLLSSVAGLQTGSGFGTIEGKTGGAVFGLLSSTSTTVLDAGIKIKGVLGDLVKGIGTFQQYENVQVKKSSLFGLVSSTSTKTNTSTLEDPVVKAVQGIFSASKNAILTAGAQFGTKTEAELTAIIDSSVTDFSVSTKGKSGTEIAAALEAELGITINKVIEQAYPFIATFQKVGEGILTTLTRVSSDITTVNTTFESVGISFKNTVGTINEATVTMYEALVDAAGGIDKFVSKSNFYRDNFLTELQKLAPVQKAVTAEMALMGLSSIKTKEEFVNVVSSLDLTSKQGQETYTKLMAVAEGFNTVAAAAEKFRTESLSQYIKNLQLEGNVTKAISESRIEELRNVDPLLKTQREYQFQLEDQIKLRKLDTELLTASGNTFAATLAQRQEELLTLTDAERVIKKLIYAQQDQSKILTAQLETLNALGLSYDALQIERMKQLQGLSEEEQLYKKRTFAAQDAAKTETLQLELMDAVGDTNGALVLRRKAELKGLSATDAALKTRIWLLQDEKKLLDQKVSQEVKIYELLGKSEEALRITRAQELAQLDPQLQANQLYIYALEDEAALKEKLKAAYDKESTTLKETISRTKDFTKTLRDYRDSLLLGDNSILTPAQKYAEAKRQYLQTAAIATSLAVTDAQKAAQSDAVSKLPTVSDNFLQASKVLYASSDAYTNDFNSVLDILDKTSSYFDGAESDAQRTLDKLEEQKSIQQIIADNTESTTVLLQKYFEAQSATEAARVNAAVGGSNAAGGSFIAPTATATNASAYIDATGVGWIHGTAGFTGTFAEGQAIIVDALSKIDAGTMSASELISALIKQGITGSMLDTILGKSQGTSSAWAIAHGLPAFAAGGLASGMALVGESGPEVVDFKTPGRVYSNSQTNSMYGSNQELIKEIQGLRDEVKQLRAEQHEQTGHLIKTNYDANNMVAERVANAQADAANSANWRSRSIPKIA